MEESRGRLRSVPWAIGGVLLLMLAGCGGSEDPGEAAAVAEPEPDTLAQQFNLVKPEEPDRVVATVNGTEITAGDVYSTANTTRLQMAMQGQQLDQRDSDYLLSDTLRGMIYGELMLQEAESLGLSVDEAEIDAVMETIRGRFADEQGYQDYLLKNEMTDDDIRAEATRRTLMERYRNQVLEQVPPVTEAEARAFYDKNPQLFLDEEQVRVAQILIKSARQDSPEMRDQAQALIEEVYEKAAAGEDFAELAREYSQAPTAAKGGDIGFFTRGKMVPQFEEMSFNTPVGEVSAAFETPFGFNVVKVLERRAPRPRPFDEIKLELQPRLQQLKQLGALDASLLELREGATVEILDESLKGPSESDPAAAVAGG